MSRRHEKADVRRTHERRAREKAREVLGRSSSLQGEALEQVVCRRAENMANCTCPLCKRDRYASDGLSRKDLRRLAGRGEDD